MKTIKNEMIAAFDVDKTLIFDCEPSHPDAIQFCDPYGGEIRCIRPHHAHIKALKDNWHRGYTVFVWSANGYRHAESVVYTLRLEEYVHFCMSKFNKFFDDLPAEQVLINQIYLEDKPRG